MNVSTASESTLVIARHLEIQRLNVKLALEGKRMCSKCEGVLELNTANFYFYPSLGRWFARCVPCERARQRARVRTEEYRQKSNERKRKVYHARPQHLTDEQWEREKLRRRERYASDAEHREATLARNRQRYAEDEAFRRRVAERRAINRAKQFEKAIQADGTLEPSYVERVRAIARIRLIQDLSPEAAEVFDGADSNDTALPFIQTELASFASAYQRVGGQL